MNNLFKISDEILKKITLFILGLTYSISSISCSDSPTSRVIDPPLKVILRIRDNNDERQLYVVKADGSELLQLTASESSKSEAVWSPDGSKIAYTSDRGRPRFFHDIHTINPDGTEDINLTDSPDILESQPAWSPDGSKIAFLRDGVAGGIFIMNQDGTNQKNLTPNLAGRLLSYPAWSFNGSKIAFTLVNPVYDSEIWVMNTDGTEQINLTPNSGENFHHVWSPNGSKIAFVSTRNQGEEVFVMDINSSNIVQLTDHSEHHARKPFWSPDGEKIVYEGWVSAFIVNIFIVDVDGTGKLKITDGMHKDAGPTWSPDGATIAFYSNRGGARRLHIMNADGSEIIRPNNDLREDQFRYIPWSPVRR